MEPRADPSSLRAALDANVHDGLRLATGVLGGLLAFFVVVDLVITPARWALQVALVDLVTASLFLVTYLAYRRDMIRPAYAHLVGTVLAGAIAAGSLHDAFVLGDPEQTTYLMLVAVGAGSMFLNLRWLYVIVGGSLVGWAVVAQAHPEVDWTTFGFALFAASVLSVLIHIVRYNTFERMESLRLAEAGRKEQLEIRESALESAIEALQDSEERYRRLVEGAPDAFLVHSEGRVLYANTAAVKLFGAASVNDLIGREAMDLFHADFREQARVRNERLEKELRTTDPLEMVCLRLDGSSVNVEAVGQPITYSGRPADQTVLRDITDRKRAEAEKDVAGQRLAEISRLKEMDRVKTQFVNTVSHELRTPLTPIKVQLHIMKGARTPEQQQKALEVVDRNVARLSGLVDELLEVARIQAGTLRLAKSYLDLGVTVQLALDSFVDVAQQNGVDLSIKIEPDVEILGDARRIQQIIYNLMGNAFKFTDRAGHILVEVRPEGANALVSVTDSGAGLEPDEVARLFEAFSQVHDTMEKTNAGTGLGLYICRGIVEGHGGRIWVESDGRGKGSRFKFTIPLEPTRA